MANEYVVLDSDAFANERVARNFAAGADGGILLNLNKTTDARLIPHCTAVKVSEAEHLDGPPQGNIGSDAVKRFMPSLWCAGVRSCFSLLRHEESSLVVPTWPTFASLNPRRQVAAGLTTNRRSVSSSSGPNAWAGKFLSLEPLPCGTQAG